MKRFLMLAGVAVVAGAIYVPAEAEVLVACAQTAVPVDRFGDGTRGRRARRR